MGIDAVQHSINLQIKLGPGTGAIMRAHEKRGEGRLESSK
jgi:hypothetical protein